MKRKFQGYYDFDSKQIEKIWNDSIIIFDANVLLSLYSNSKEINEEIFKMFNLLKERIWIPYRVIAEYEKNRMKVINNECKKFNYIKSVPNEIKNKFLKEIKGMEKHPSQKYETLKKIIEDKFSDVERQFKEETKDMRTLSKEYAGIKEHDYIREKLNLFSFTIGDDYTVEQLLKIVKIGQLRYESKIPPGYEDYYTNKKKGIDLYGDLIIWFEIVDKAKIEKKPVLFITNDTKEDWYQDNKNFKPRPELINELYSCAGVYCYIYTFDEFYKQANTRLFNKSEEQIEDNVNHLKKIREREELIENNLFNVAQIVKKYDDGRNKIDDLVSIGTIGLIKGINSYKESFKDDFDKYIRKYIESEIIEYLK
ncbi:TPA: PIN-like domain-containing protein [Clostridium sporogenes]